MNTNQRNAMRLARAQNKLRLGAVAAPDHGDGLQVPADFKYEHVLDVIALLRQNNIRTDDHVLVQRGGAGVPWLEAAALLQNRELAALVPEPSATNNKGARL